MAGVSRAGSALSGLERLVPGWPSIIRPAPVLRSTANRGLSSKQRGVSHPTPGVVKLALVAAAASAWGSSSNELDIFDAVHTQDRHSSGLAWQSPLAGAFLLGALTIVGFLLPQKPFASWDITVGAAKVADAAPLINWKTKAWGLTSKAPAQLQAAARSTSQIAISTMQSPVLRIGVLLGCLSGALLILRLSTDDETPQSATVTQPRQYSAAQDDSSRTLPPQPPKQLPQPPEPPQRPPQPPKPPQPKMTAAAPSARPSDLSAATVGTSLPADQRPATSTFQHTASPVQILHAGGSPASFISLGGANGATELHIHVNVAVQQLVQPQPAVQQSEPRVVVSFVAREEQHQEGTDRFTGQQEDALVPRPEESEGSSAVEVSAEVVEEVPTDLPAEGPELLPAAEATASVPPPNPEEEKEDDSVVSAAVDACIPLREDSQPVEIVSTSPSPAPLQDEDVQHIADEMHSGVVAMFDTVFGPPADSQHAQDGHPGSAHSSSHSVPEVPQAVQPVAAAPRPTAFPKAVPVQAASYRSPSYVRYSQAHAPSHEQASAGQHLNSKGNSAPALTVAELMSSAVQSLTDMFQGKPPRKAEPAAAVEEAPVLGLGRVGQLRSAGPGRVMSVSFRGVEGLEPAEAQAAAQLAEVGPWIMLAPVLPFMNKLWGGGGGARAAPRRETVEKVETVETVDPRFAKYDTFHEMLQTSAERFQEPKYDVVRSVLNLVPSKGVQKYDVLRHLLRDMVAAPDHPGTILPGIVAPGHSKYDILWDLLARGKEEGGAAWQPKYDPIYSMLKGAAMGADGWGTAPYDPVADMLARGLSGDSWGDGRYDPLSSVFSEETGSWAEAPRYDPLTSAFSQETGVFGPARYDPLTALFSDAVGGWAEPPRYDPISWLFEGAAVPVGAAKYDPLPQLLAARAPRVRGKYDPMSELVVAQPPTQTKYDMIADILSAQVPGSEKPEGFDVVGNIVTWLAHSARPWAGRRVPRHLFNKQGEGRQTAAAPAAGSAGDARAWLEQVRTFTGPMEEDWEGLAKYDPLRAISRKQPAAAAPAPKYDPLHALVKARAAPAASKYDPLKALLSIGPPTRASKPAPAPEPEPVPAPVLAPVPVAPEVVEQEEVPVHLELAAESGNGRLSMPEFVSTLGMPFGSGDAPAHSPDDVPTHHLPEPSPPAPAPGHHAAANAAMSGSAAGGYHYDVFVRNMMRLRPSTSAPAPPNHAAVNAAMSGSAVVGYDYDLFVHDVMRLQGALCGECVPIQVDLLEVLMRRGGSAGPLADLFPAFRAMVEDGSLTRKYEPLFRAMQVAAKARPDTIHQAAHAHMHSLPAAHLQSAAECIPGFLADIEGRYGAVHARLRELEPQVAVRMLCALRDLEAAVAGAKPVLAAPALERELVARALGSS